MDKKIRNRGIRASREKIEIAMLNAGIKTQASLANKIAEQENLSTPPKDTINRVFREKPVSTTTITRIAKVLKVEPHTLYLTLKSDQKTTPDSKKIFSKNTKPVLGKFSLVLNCLNPGLNPLTKSIHQKIKKHIKSVIMNPSFLPDQYMSVDIARKYQTDGVLSIRSQNIDRFLAIQFFLYFEGVEKLIWTLSITTIELSQQPEQYAEQLLPVINHFFDFEPGTDKPPSFESIEAQEKYLRARHLLEDQQSETSLKRAQNLLSSAIKLSPEFAQAHAALAESFIFESWRSDTRELLEDAQEACNTAVKFAPDNAYVNATLSHLYRVTGRIPESIQLCKDILATHKDNIDALSGLANTYMEAHKQTLPDIPDADRQALFFAEKSVEIEPDYWKHYLDLGNNRFLTGNPLEALPAYEKSALLNPKELTYINLGVMNLCQNQFSKAIQFFNQAQELSPESYLSYENLGNVYFMTGNFNKSIEYKERALDTFPEKQKASIHEMWGTLADAYRQAGNQQKAIETYSNAINIIERDNLQGYSDQTSIVCHYFYFYIMSLFQPDQYPVDYLQQISKRPEEFIEQELSPGAYVKLAYILFLQGDNNQSKRAILKATSICPVFFQHPDIKPALKTLGLASPF